VHYAASTEPICFDDSVKNIVEKFKNDSVDFHQTVADLASISRTQAKTINLGLFYGMGKAKLQAELGLNTKQEAEELFNQYHNNVPFVRDLMTYTSNQAQTGSIGTLLGRRCRFNKWEPSTFGMHTPMDFEEAERTYGRGRIRRAFTYKALNKLIQGSAADMTKKAMLDLYNEGIIPHIQIHDELDISIESENQAKKIIEIMENAVTLAVPNKVDFESGSTWGDING
jgi:DNA polymerase I-like protein with 3'-5' exonuclease and polymerase domains